MASPHPGPVADSNWTLAFGGRRAVFRGPFPGFASAPLASGAAPSGFRAAAGPKPAPAAAGLGPPRKGGPISPKPQSGAGAVT